MYLRLTLEVVEQLLKVVESNHLPQRKQTLTLKKNQTVHPMRWWLGVLCSPAGCFSSVATQLATCEKNWVATPRCFTWNHVSHAIVPTVLPATPQQSVACFSSEFKDQNHPLGSLVMMTWDHWPRLVFHSVCCFAQWVLLEGSQAVLLCYGADMEGRTLNKSLPKSNWGLRGLLPVEFCGTYITCKVANFSWVRHNFCSVGGCWQARNCCQSELLDTLAAFCHKVLCQEYIHCL